MKFRFIIPFIIAFLSVTGCIREDRSGCPGDVILTFLYTGDGYSDIFPDTIDKVDMYVYSTVDNSFVAHTTLTKEELEKNQGARLSLLPGTYRIVLWGNAFDRTETDYGPDDAKVSEPGFYSDPEEYGGTDPLYWSCVEISVPETLRDEERECIFKSSHIKMYVRLTGFRDIIGPDGEDIVISVTHSGCPAYTDFANIPSSDRLCDITPPLVGDPEDEDSYILTYNVLRFGEDDDTYIILTDTKDGSELYRISIRDFVRKYNIPVDGVEEVTIPVQITTGPVGIEITEWNVENVKPGFDK